MSGGEAVGMQDQPVINDIAEIDVEPIRTLESIATIKKQLGERPRDLLLFTLGINNGVRAGDLLRITVNEIRAVQPGGALLIREKKTGGTYKLVIHAESHRALQAHLDDLRPPPPPENMYLFASNRGWTPLTTQRLDALVREWTQAAGVTGTFGAHSLRKTFGYIQRVCFGVGFDVLAKRFNHPSPSVTMRYLNLSSEGDDEAPLAPI